MTTMTSMVLFFVTVLMSACVAACAVMIRRLQRQIRNLNEAQGLSAEAMRLLNERVNTLKPTWEDTLKMKVVDAVTESAKPLFDRVVTIEETPCVQAHLLRKAVVFAAKGKIISVDSDITALSTPVLQSLVRQAISREAFEDAARFQAEIDRR